MAHPLVAAILWRFIRGRTVEGALVVAAIPAEMTVGNACFAWFEWSDVVNRVLDFLESAYRSSARS